MLGVYFISLIAGAIITFNTVIEFNHKATLSEETEFTIAPETTLSLTVRKIGFEDYREPTITLAGYEGNSVLLEKNTYSRGFSREDALEKASMLLHEVTQKNDSTLVIDSDVRFKDDAVFRGQNLNMKMFIPYGQKFEMDYGMRNILRNTIYRNGFSNSQIVNNTWVFTESGLNCLSCKENKEDDSTLFTETLESENDSDGFYKVPFKLGNNANKRTLDNQNFNEISIGTGLFLEVIRGDKYSVQVISETDDLDKLEIEQSSDMLKIYYDNDEWGWRKPDIKIIITTPELKEMNVSSAAVVHIKGFNQEKLNLELSSSGKIYFAGTVEKLEADVSSASKLYLKGKVSQLKIDASSAAQVNAIEMEANNVNADASSAAIINIAVLDYLNGNASSTGRIKYKGNPELNTNAGSGGRISKY